jgi:tetratricopeptide (TPR) repeat protein
MVMGSVSCVFAFFGARALFGSTTGLVAGLMLAIYPPAIFFDGIIGKAGLGLFLLTGLLALLLRHQLRPASRLCLFAGLALGLLALTRENALALLPTIPLWLWLRFGEKTARERGRWIAAFAIGAGVLMLFVGIRNQIVGDTFALTTTQLGSNFYMGNSPEATGLYVPLIAGRHTPVFEASDAELLAERELGRELTRGEVSSYWLARGLEFVRDEPLRWLELMAIKTALTWGAFEIADVEDIYVYADSAWLLRWLLRVWNFGLLAPLACAGFVMAWPRRHDLSLLAALAFVYTGSVALFITFARFRLPLVPMILPLAAFAVVESVRLAWDGRPGDLRRPALVFLLAFVALGWPMLDEERAVRASYANLAGIMLNQDRLEEAERYLSRAAAAQSENADLQFHMAVLRYEQARYEEARGHLRKMISAEPADHRGHRLLGRVYEALGQPELARRYARRAFQLNPNPNKLGQPYAPAGQAPRSD